MSDDTEDLKGPRTHDEEKMLRQFLHTDGPKGNSRKYKRGWEFSFNFSQTARDAVNAIMEKGVSFDEAFDLVVEGRDSEAEYVQYGGERFRIRQPTPAENFEGPADLLYFPKRG